MSPLRAFACAVCASLPFGATSVAAGVEFYVLGNAPGNADLYRGTLDDGIATRVGQTAMSGNGTASIEFAPDGRLFALDVLPAPGVVHEINPSTAASSVVLTPEPTALLHRSMTIDSAGDVVVWSLVGAGQSRVQRYDIETGQTLSTVMIDTLALGFNSLPPGGITFRDDGTLMVFFRNLMLGVDLSAGTIDPVAEFDPDAVFTRGVSTLGGTTYMLSNGNTVYDADLYTGELREVATLSGVTAGGDVFSFAAIPAPITAAPVSVLGLYAARRRR